MIWTPVTTQRWFACDAAAGPSSETWIHKMLISPFRPPSTSADWKKKLTFLFQIPLYTLLLISVDSGLPVRLLRSDLLFGSELSGEKIYYKVFNTTNWFQITVLCRPTKCVFDWRWVKLKKKKIIQGSCTLLRSFTNGAPFVLFKKRNTHFYFLALSILNWRFKAQELRPYITQLFTTITKPSCRHLNILIVNPVHITELQWN